MRRIATALALLLCASGSTVSWSTPAHATVRQRVSFTAVGCKTTNESLLTNQYEFAVDNNDPSLCRFEVRISPSKPDRIIDIERWYDPMGYKVTRWLSWGLNDAENGLRKTKNGRLSISPWRQGDMCSLDRVTRHRIVIRSGKDKDPYPYADDVLAVSRIFTIRHFWETPSCDYVIKPPSAEPTVCSETPRYLPLVPMPGDQFFTELAAPSQVRITAVGDHLVVTASPVLGAEKYRMFSERSFVDEPFTLERRIKNGALQPGCVRVDVQPGRRVGSTQQETWGYLATAQFVVEPPPLPESVSVVSKKKKTVDVEIVPAIDTPADATWCVYNSWQKSLGCQPIADLTMSVNGSSGSRIISVRVFSPRGASYFSRSTQVEVP